MWGASLSQSLPTGVESALHFGHECPKWRRCEGITGDYPFVRACFRASSATSGHETATARAKKMIGRFGKELGLRRLRSRDLPEMRKSPIDNPSTAKTDL